jgi:hypothetical protein
MTARARLLNIIKPKLGASCFFLAFLISSCGSSMNSPDIKRNPHPKMRYEITLTIQGAPGPFDSVMANMAYEVTNEQCAPFDKFIGIYRKPSTQHLPIALQRVGDGVYQGEAYLDLLQDDDYYGLGACHWAMTFVTAQLKVGEATFSPFISTAEIVGQQSTARFFAKRSFGDKAIKDMHYPGTTLEDVVQRRDDFFSATLSAKEAFE